MSGRAKLDGWNKYNRNLATTLTLLEALGGEAGCMRLSKAFYTRVHRDPVLRPLFPGKSMRCATEELSAFLVQFLDGDEAHTQKRWWLSLRESHARFRIDPAQRAAWLKHMRATLDEAPLDDTTRTALHQFFGHTSTYVTDAPEDTPAPQHEELSERWKRQRRLDDTIAAIAAGGVGDAQHFISRPAIFAGLLTRMLKSGNQDFVLNAIEQDPSLAARLLHHAAATGSLEVVETCLRHNADPNMHDAGGHTPLYRVANHPAIVRALVKAGANVNGDGGVTKATPLHMAARRGHLETARTLLELGADRNARDTKGDTPYQRAINCRKTAVANLLR